MTVDEARAHYLRFLESHQWLANALTWTVVHPWAEAPPPVDLIASRLTGGGSPEIVELRIRETDLYPMEVVFAGASGPSMMLLEANGAYTSGPEVIRRLSENARVWSLSWHVNGGERLTYAAGGEILAEVPGLDPTLLTGSRPSPGGQRTPPTVPRGCARRPWSRSGSRCSTPLSGRRISRPSPVPGRS
ncbi:hypothetical protein AB0L30_33395 [Microbispora rosea]|uniref:hypothetical protein n=1 Tax=Microbispora rosea TaxID=58117 RepID=UPI00341528BC